MNLRSILPRRAAALCLSAALAATTGLAACSQQTEAPGGGKVDEPQPSENITPHSEVPSADPTTAPPSGALTEAQLPTGAELAWHEFGDWTAGDTHTGSGNEQLSMCQVNKFESTGANAIQVRTFTRAEGKAVAAAMSFDTPELAEQARNTLAGWVDSCPEMLGERGMSGVKPTFSHQAVEVANGKAEASELGWNDNGAGTFESIGITGTGSRVEWVAMTVKGEDSNWDTEPGGPVGAVHPMIRSLPEVTLKLAG